MTRKFQVELMRTKPVAEISVANEIDANGRAERNRMIPEAWVYILRCEHFETLHASYYIGSTTRIYARLVEHCCGEGASYLRDNLPQEIVSIFPCPTPRDALDMESEMHRLRNRTGEGWIKELATLRENCSYLSVAKLRRMDVKTVEMIEYLDLLIF